MPSDPSEIPDKLTKSTFFEVASRLLVAQRLLAREAQTALLNLTARHRRKRIAMGGCRMKKSANQFSVFDGPATRTWGRHTRLLRKLAPVLGATALVAMALAPPAFAQSAPGLTVEIGDSAF